MSHSKIHDLPTENVRRIFEFVGPDPKVLEAHKKIITLFRKKCIGIPSWEITEYNNGIIYLFSIPDYDYYENVKIKGVDRITNYDDIPINDDISTNKYVLKEKHNAFKTYNHGLWHSYFLVLKYSEVRKNIRNNIFLTPTSIYGITGQGSRTFAPFIPIPYSSMNDYDILHTLNLIRWKKISKGKPRIFEEQSVEDIRKWIKNRIKILGEKEQTYHRRILDKWMELAEKAKQENI